jgi:hypothetical protein
VIGRWEELFPYTVFCISEYISALSIACSFHYPLVMLSSSTSWWNCQQKQRCVAFHLAILLLLPRKGCVGVRLQLSCGAPYLGAPSCCVMNIQSRGKKDCCRNSFSCDLSLHREDIVAQARHYLCCYSEVGAAGTTLGCARHTLAHPSALDTLSDQASRFARQLDTSSPEIC